MFSIFVCHHFFQVSSESQFEYAWCLVRSRYPADIRKGIILLEDLFQVFSETMFFLQNIFQVIFEENTYKTLDIYS